MKQPSFLKEQDSIYRIAPSFGITCEPYKTRFKAALDVFKSLGYKVRLGKNVYKNDGFVASAGAKERAEEFIEAYSSDASLILSVGGGERERDRLPYLDFDQISSLPSKWFRGSSDNTHLAFLLTTLSNVRTIYSSNAPSFFSSPLLFGEKDALRRLKGEKTFTGYPSYSPPFKTDNPLEPLHLSAKKTILPINYASPVEGTRIGGCLDCLSLLCGTEYDRVKEFSENHPEGLIFYLEACDLNPLSIYRALFQLREANWFSSVNAFLIGRPLCQDRELFKVDSHKAVLQALSPLNKPILMDVDLGHIQPALPFRNGAKAKVSLDKENEITIVYS